MTEISKNALIIYYKLEDPVPYVTRMLVYMGYSVTSAQYKKVEQKDLVVVAVDLIVITTPETTRSYIPEALDKLLTKLWVMGVPILGLGDVNSTIVETLNQRTAIIENHMLKATEIHNIKDYHENEYFIPSMHKTTLFLDEVDYYDIKKKESVTNRYSFIGVVCSSPNRSPGYNLPLRDGVPYGSSDAEPDNFYEVEIFLMDAMNYIGIYGAPELFFAERDSHINYTTKKTMGLIESLIKIIQNE